MSRDLIRLMHALFLPGAEACREAPWRPNTDVVRTPDGWLVKFELPGVRAEDVDLQALGGRLTLRGVRRDHTTPPGCVYYQLEITYSHFERSLGLPCDLEKADVSTDFRDGMLLVRVRPAPGTGEEART